MRNILIQGTKKYGIHLSNGAVEQFRRYNELLEDRNKFMNLTAIAGEKDVAELHFLDSLALLTVGSFVDRTVIDIGSGAGFPGVPMKIAEPSIRLTLLDSQQKRISFLEELSALLSMPDISCLHARAEEAALLADMRDRFDFAVSRAVARLNVLAEMCLPFVKPGGAFIAMKGTDSDEEIEEAKNALAILGAVVENIFDYIVPGTDVKHRAVIARKTAPTPSGYPRRFAKIEKKPL
jgi:16S rRNA (guanine527-N7)-methyltransferase